jgi:mevalonate kinase
MKVSFHSNGKLLLTGEYAVLDGALALGLPCRLGQGLTISADPGDDLVWQSLDHNLVPWFETRFKASELKVKTLKATTSGIRDTLLNILHGAIALNPDFLHKLQGRTATSKLEFPRDWGLGSSSTLINNIAQWAEVNAYTLLWNTFSGSGYDIACAQNKQPLIYQLKGTTPQVDLLEFNPPFTRELYFVHLNKKQNSREGIKRYKSVVANKQDFLDEVSEITRSVVRCSILANLQELLLRHEELLSKTMQLPRIQDQLFPDFNGLIKSLGAWGGDFVLALGTDHIPEYFHSKGYSTVLSYDELVL